MDEQGNSAGKGDRLQHGNSAGHPADTEDEGQHGEDSGDEVEKGPGGSFRGSVDPIGVVFISFSRITFLT